MKKITNSSHLKKQNLSFLISFAVLFLFSFTNVTAQENESIITNTTPKIFKLNGTVFNKTDNTTLPGTSVSIKNGIAGVETDIDGNFELNNVTVGTIISFQYLGFKRKDIVVKRSQTFLNVYLEEDSFELLGAVDTKSTYKTKRSFWQRIKTIF